MSRNSTPLPAGKRLRSGRTKGSPAMTRAEQHAGALKALRREIGEVLWLLEIHHDAIVCLDEKHKILFVNQGAESVFGYRAADVVGRSLDDLLPAGLPAAVLRPASKHGTAPCPANDDKPLRRVVGLRKTGEEILLEASVSRFRYGSEQTFVLILRDVTAHVKHEQQLRYLAEHDSLTQLPNRPYFLDHLSNAVARASRHGWKSALLYVDLDGFKSVNDTLGHSAGDTLLQTVAARLQATIRESDTVARFGGDEFTAILEDVHGKQDALEIAEKMLTALDSPVVAGGALIGLSASIGISLYPDHGKDADTLLLRAERAMYVAKRHGRPQISATETVPLPHEVKDEQSSFRKANQLRRNRR